MNRTRTTLLIICLAALVISGVNCSKGNSGITTPDIRSSRTLSNVKPNKPVAAAIMRIDTSTGSITQLPVQREIYNWTDYTNSTGSVEIVLQLQKVDTNYNRVYEAYDNIPQDEGKGMAVRFTVQLVNNTYINYSEQGDHIICPRAIIVPLNDPEDMPYLDVAMSDPTGELDIDLSEYGIDALDGPYPYQRIFTEDDEGVKYWQVQHGTMGDPTVVSEEAWCEMVFTFKSGPPPYENYVPQFIDWLVVVDGIASEEKITDSEDVWLDPYGVSNCKVIRNESIPGMYDELWNLDIIFESSNPAYSSIADVFDVSVDINMFDGEYFVETAYTAELYCAPESVTHNSYDVSGPDGEGNVTYTFSFDSAAGFFGNCPEPGMHEFEFHLSKDGEQDYYLSKTFRIPWHDGSIMSPCDAYDAGYYIVAGTGSVLDQDIYNHLALVNTFTGETRPCRHDNGELVVGAENISVQKSAGLIPDPDENQAAGEWVRVAYEDISGPRKIRVWEWGNEDSGIQEGVSDEGMAAQRNKHPDNQTGIGGVPYMPFISADGFLVSWSAAEYAWAYGPNKMCYTGEYDDYWKIHDAYASKYDFSLDQSDYIMYESSWSGITNIYQFDPNWECWEQIGGLPFIFRCGQQLKGPGGEGQKCPNADAQAQDGALLMSPSISGPTHYDYLPGDINDEGDNHNDVYAVVASMGSDCWSNLTPLIFFFIRYDEPDNRLESEIEYSTVMVEKVIYAQQDYWDFNPGSEIKEPSVCVHPGYEKHLLNPRISADGHSVVYEAYDGGNCRIYKVDLLEDGHKTNGFIVNPQLVGLSPITGAQQFKPAISASHWDSYGYDDPIRISNEMDVIAYQDGIDSGTDIWVALEISAGTFVKINVTGPIIDLNFHTYSGQPDLAAWKDDDGNIKGGLVFVSHEYDQGDLFFVDYVYCDGGCTIPGIGTFEHFTRLRRITNLGDVMEAKMTDLIMLPL